MRLEILIGMIASGKSTYARHRADQGALVVCHDDLTEILHKRYRYEADRRDFYRMLLHTIADGCLCAGNDTIVDRTNLTRKARSEWIDLGRRWGAEVEAVVFPRTDTTIHAARRWTADGRGRSSTEWHAVAEHHAEQMDKEPVTLAEGFDSIVNVPVADIVKWAAEPNPFPAYLPPREATQQQR